MCDSWGVGDAPDAAAYGDVGSDTLGNTARAVGGIRAPHLAALGLGTLTAIEGLPPGGAPGTAAGRATEVSAGKDTTTGHWEMMGIRVERPFPLYPDGFPAAIDGAVRRARSGPRRSATCPRPAPRSSSASARSTCAPARPSSTRAGIPCSRSRPTPTVSRSRPSTRGAQIARDLLAGPHAVGRVIARPFDGEPGAFRRRPERRDYSVPPPGPTTLDALATAGVPVVGIGKIRDIFVGHGIDSWSYSDSNDHGVDLTIEALREPGARFVFTNLVDFDSKYGHRNDPDGYARAIEAFDARVPDLLAALDGGVLLVTGDHGCDPTTPPTDHSRERTPLLAGGLVGGPHDIGTRGSFADLGATVAELLGVATPELPGTSFVDRLGPVEP